MGRTRKVKRQKRFQYDKNRKNQWKKEKKGRAVVVESEAMKRAWDPRKNVDQNMADMGLSTDPNKAIRTQKRGRKTAAGVGVAEQPPSKSHVVEEMEAEASCAKFEPLKLSEPEAKYAIYMLEKYGDDYKAMARDGRNVFQDTPKQIRKKVFKFKSVKAQYEAYLSAKKTGELYRMMDLD